MNNQKKVTSELANYVFQIAYDQIPVEVIEYSKSLIIDQLGVALAAIHLPVYRCAQDFLKSGFCEGKIRVWGNGMKSHLPGAVWINSILASALDLDDGHRLALGHPGAGMIPSAIVMAESRQMSGRRLIEAIVVGYEVAIRASMARDMWKKDNVCTGHWIGFGTAVSAGKLILESPEKIENAFGLVAMFNPELPGYLPLMRNMVKEGIPWAAVTGVQAALLSEAGFSGPIHVFDYLKNYYDSEKLLSEIGNTYLMKETTLKRYSCCAWIHPIVKLCHNIMKENQLKADEIDQVRVKTFSRAARLSNITNPQTIEDAQFSIPFCCATVITKGEKALYVLGPKDLHDLKIARIAKKVCILKDEEIERAYPKKMKTKIEIEVHGKLFEKEYNGPEKGDSLTVFSREEVKEKYFRCAEPVIGCKQAKTLFNYIEKLDVVPTVKISRHMIIKNI